MARRRAHHVGRLRIAAAKILSQGFGFQVEPSEIHPATGAWRTDVRLDVYRWELFTKNERGLPVVAGCYDTLTEFVRVARQTGFHIHKDEIYAGQHAG